MSSNDFPVEILHNILSRLPVKDIIRLRCVCKLWRDFVVDPDFVSTHLSLQNDRSSKCMLQYKTDRRHGNGGKDVFLVFHDRSLAKYSKLEIPFSCEQPKTSFRLVGSVDGLICLSFSSKMFGRTLYLWNPSIWKLKMLRQSCFHRRFDQSKTFFVMGFGFHKRANDYKIVRIMYFQRVSRPYVEKIPPKVEVFSLARNTWRNIGTAAGYYANTECSTVVVNECLHWIAFRTKDDFSMFVLAFDFGSEKFGDITLPTYDHDGDGEYRPPQVSVTVLRGSLALIVSCYKTLGPINCCHVWVMSEYGKAESWTKQYSIVPNQSCFRCLGIINDMDLMFDTCDNEGMISYDFDQQQYKPLGFSEIIYGLVTFRESFVLFKEGFNLTPRKYLLVEGGIRLGKRKRKRSVFMKLQRKWR